MIETNWKEEILESEASYRGRDKNGNIIFDDITLEQKTPQIQAPTPLIRKNLGIQIGNIFDYCEEVNDARYLKCDGSLIAVEDYPELCSLLKTYYPRTQSESLETAFPTTRSYFYIDDEIAYIFNGSNIWYSFDKKTWIQHPLKLNYNNVNVFGFAYKAGAFYIAYNWWSTDASNNTGYYGIIKSELGSDTYTWYKRTVTDRYEKASTSDYKYKMFAYFNDNFYFINNSYSGDIYKNENIDTEIGNLSSEFCRFYIFGNNLYIIDERYLYKIENDTLTKLGSLAEFGINFTYVSVSDDLPILVINGKVYMYYDNTLYFSEDGVNFTSRKTSLFSATSFIVGTDKYAYSSSGKLIDFETEQVLSDDVFSARPLYVLEENDEKISFMTANSKIETYEKNKLRMLPKYNAPYETVTTGQQVYTYIKALL